MISFILVLMQISISAEQLKTIKEWIEPVFWPALWWLVRRTRIRLNKVITDNSNRIYDQLAELLDKKFQNNTIGQEKDLGHKLNELTVSQTKDLAEKLSAINKTQETYIDRKFAAHEDCAFARIEGLEANDELFRAKLQEIDATLAEFTKVLKGTCRNYGPDGKCNISKT